MASFPRPPEGAAGPAIDYSLARLKKDGTLDELYLRWFPIGFY